MAVAYSTKSTSGQLATTATTALSIAVTPTADDYVLAVVCWNGTPTLGTVMCGLQAMTQVGSTYPTGGSGSNGRLAFYELYGATGGAVTITGTLSATARIAATAICYSGVGSSAVLISGGSLSTGVSIASQTCPTGGMIVAGMGGASSSAGSISGTTGGNSRFVGSATNPALGIADNNANTAFTASIGFNYTAYAVVALSPPAGLDPASGTLTLSGGAQSIDTKIDPASGSITLTGGAGEVSTVEAGVIEPESGLFVITGGDQSIDTRIDPSNTTITLTGDVQLLIQSPTNPFNHEREQLDAVQSIRRIHIGDSTTQGYGDATGAGGFPTYFNLMLGCARGVSVKNPSTTIYNAGSTNFIYFTNAGVGLTTIGNGVAQLNAGSYNLTSPAPTMFTIDFGINDMGIGGQSGATYAAAMRSFVEDLHDAFPDAAICITTENPIGPSDGQKAGFETMVLGLTGQTLPLSTPFAQTDIPNVFVLDTRQTFGNAYAASLMYDSLHPNTNGYKGKAQWALRSIAGYDVLLPDSTALSLSGIAPSLDLRIDPVSGTFILVGGNGDVATVPPNVIEAASGQLILAGGEQSIDTRIDPPSTDLILEVGDGEVSGSSEESQPDYPVITVIIPDMPVLTIVA